MPGLLNAKSVDILWRFGFLDRILFRQYQAKRKMPGTLIGKEKIEIRQVGRLYLVPSDLCFMHQCKIITGPVITMNKGGHIFVLGVNGQQVVVPNQVLQQGTIGLGSSMVLGIMRKHIASTVIERGIKITI